MKGPSVGLAQEEPKGTYQQRLIMRGSGVSFLACLTNELNRRGLTINLWSGLEPGSAPLGLYTRCAPQSHVIRPVGLPEGLEVGRQRSSGSTNGCSFVAKYPDPWRASPTGSITWPCTPHHISARPHMGAWGQAGLITPAD